MVEMVLQELLHKVEPLMRKAGQLQLSLFRSTRLHVRIKADGSYVCDADLESERILKEGLHEILPEAGFFAEESGKSGSGGPYQWVIDPLDGTTNYVHGIPYFCISVALTYENKPIWSAIYHPVVNDFFYAVAGNGAFLNGSRLTLDQDEPFNKTMVVISLPYIKNEGYKKILDMLPYIAYKTYAFRYLGAAALDQAYLAAGGIDGLFFSGLGWWDIAAGMLLIREAGGRVTDFEGFEITPNYHSYLAGTKAVHNELLEILKKSSS